MKKLRKDDAYTGKKPKVVVYVLMRKRVIAVSIPISRGMVPDSLLLPV